MNPDRSDLLHAIPDIQKIHPKDAILLGSLISGSCSIDAMLPRKVNALTTMGSRLCHFSKHNVFLLLHYSFAIPKILYVVRTAHCFSSPMLEVFDRELGSVLSTVLYINFECTDI